MKRDLSASRPALRRIGVGQRLLERISIVEWPSVARLNLARRAHRDDAALVDDRHAVAEPFGFLDVVRGQQNGALFAPQLGDEP